MRNVLHRMLREPGAGAAMIMVVWGLWGIMPFTAAYADAAIFDGLRPITNWSVFMIFAGATFAVGVVLPSGNSNKFAITALGGVLMIGIWSGMLVAIWAHKVVAGGVPPPAGGIVFLYLVWTFAALIARAKGEFN